MSSVLPAVFPSQPTTRVLSKCDHHRSMLSHDSRNRGSLGYSRTGGSDKPFTVDCSSIWCDYTIFDLGLLLKAPEVTKRLTANCTMSAQSSAAENAAATGWSPCATADHPDSPGASQIARAPAGNISAQSAKRKSLSQSTRLLKGESTAGPSRLRYTLQVQTDAPDYPGNCSPRVSKHSGRRNTPKINATAVVATGTPTLP